MNDFELIRDQIEMAPRKSSVRDWAEGILGFAAIGAFVFVLLQLASQSK